MQSHQRQIARQRHRRGPHSADRSFLSETGNKLNNARRSKIRIVAAGGSRPIPGLGSSEFGEQFNKRSKSAKLNPRDDARRDQRGAEQQGLQHADEGGGAHAAEHDI